MKIAIATLALTLLTFTGSASADTDARKEAEQMLAGLNMDSALTQSMEEMLNLQLAQRPSLAPFKGVMLDFLKKYMSYDSLKEEMIDIYADAFTATELREINAFYRTPTGVKTIRLLPELMAKGGQLGARKVQEHMEELQDMLTAEAKRLKEQR